MKHPEHIQPSEMLHGAARDIATTEPRLSDAAINRAFRAREAMLASVHEFISPALQEALVQKLRYERAALQKMAEAEEKTQAERKRQSLRLNSTYFTLTPLEIDLL